MLRTGRRCRPWRADVAQLVAHHLAKVRVAGSNPVIRSEHDISTVAVWPSGEATACKAVHTGSIPVSTSTSFQPGAISSAGERFPDTEEVTGSIPVSRTTVLAAEARWVACLVIRDTSAEVSGPSRKHDGNPRLRQGVSLTRPNLGRTPEMTRVLLMARKRMPGTVSVSTIAAIRSQRARSSFRQGGKRATSRR